MVNTIFPTPRARQPGSSHSPFASKSQCRAVVLNCSGGTEKRVHPLTNAGTSNACFPYPSVQTNRWVAHFLVPYDSYVPLMLSVASLVFFDTLAELLNEPRFPYGIPKS
jgi:hypothetical protein